MTIAIVGIGLIGGSMAIDLRKRGFADKIIGVDNNIQHQNIALLCGIVDETDTLENAIDKSDVIILSSPVDSNCLLLLQILDLIGGTSKVVTDMGSTKAGIAAISRNHSNRGRYVAAHPMAGTEYSGPMAAHSRLFDYKTAIICDPELSDTDALELVEEMLDILNITSFSLALCVLDKEHEAENILTLAGGGFESTVRLAKSNGDTWAPIFSENSGYILEVMDTYIEKMNIFRKLISEKDVKGLKVLMEEANKIQKILN
jgi:prephenate dehydrogenase